MTLRKVTVYGGACDEFSVNIDTPNNVAEEMAVLSVALKLEAQAAEMRIQSGVQVQGLVDKKTANLPNRMNSDYCLAKRAAPTIICLINASISPMRLENNLIWGFLLQGSG